MTPSTRQAFNLLADSYDTHFTQSPHGLRLRRQVWRLIDRLFVPGMRVLDVGCGTGEDAVHLALRGVTIHGLDQSNRMIERARSKLLGIRRRLAITFEVSDFENWTPGSEAPWHGILANFGVLNCLADLDRAVQRFAGCLYTSGRLVVCVMGRTAPAEWFWYSLAGKKRQAFRRRRSTACFESEEFPIRYYGFREILSIFKPRFELEEVSSLGPLLPPELEVYLPSRFGLRDRLLRGEERLGRCFPFNRYGDHLLMVFQRLPQG